MALDFKGIKVVMSGLNVPTGALPSNYTDVEGDYFSKEEIFGIDKSSVESANPSDTWNSLIAFLDTAIQAKLSNDYDESTNIVEAVADLMGVSSNLQGDADNSDMYKNEAPDYLCKVILRIKIS